MRMKDETLDQYKAWLKTQYGVSIKVFHSDRGGEFMSNAFSEHLQKAGTIHRLTVHDTPEYNGVAERLNWTLIETTPGVPEFGYMTRAAQSLMVVPKKEDGWDLMRKAKDIASIGKAKDQ
jgi:transposase InsO family protein